MKKPPAVFICCGLAGRLRRNPQNRPSYSLRSSEYRMAQSNPNVATYAALEMKQASEAHGPSRCLHSGQDSDEKIDKLAYLARQKIALTQEVTKPKWPRPRWPTLAKGVTRFAWICRNGQCRQHQGEVGQQPLLAQN